jgi:SH3-like domain-containing protein
MGRMSLTPPPGSNDATDDRLKEIALREREIQIKAEEVELKRSEAARNSKFGPILIAIWTAAAAAAGNGIVSWFNGQQMHRLESEKAQSAVILEVVKTGSPDKAASNLAFLVEIGVISQEQAGARLRNYLQTRVAGQGPSTPGLKDGSTGDLSADAACASTGDYVVVNVHWGDDDGGLNIRIGPNKTPVGVIPTTGTGIEVGACSGGWCQVRYKCLTGWAFAQHLALRSTRLARFKDVSDPKGLLIRRDPRIDGEPAGTLPANTTDVVKHVCQPAPLSTDEEWCQISVGKMSGWVPHKNLEDQPAAPASHVVSSTIADSVKPASAITPASTAPPRPE